MPVGAQAICWNTRYFLVIENGQFQEIGSHEELLAKGGRYAELFHLQAAGYR
ncbi:hypothetical protein [Hymenobacter amundsenii]|uniref:hypothetical protein n=1 Tax=Hymenobacter amundsenii TaxID=2006685 RepID=UPI0013FDD233|nr:hypothetical protein [Hymenobacter amundsenii]